MRDAYYDAHADLIDKAWREHYERRDKGADLQ